MKTAQVQASTLRDPHAPFAATGSRAAGNDDAGGDAASNDDAGGDNRGRR